MEQVLEEKTDPGSVASNPGPSVIDWGPGFRSNLTPPARKARALSCNLGRWRCTTLETGGGRVVRTRVVQRYLTAE